MKKILLLGSGGLSIGQAGEFDYSGSQAVRAFREQGLEVVIVNPNIATVQTDPQPGVSVYLYPVDADWVEKVIIAEKVDAIVGGFGGQTALNCVLELEKRGVLARYNVKSLGTPVRGIRITEDRELFAREMRALGMPVPPGEGVSTLKDALAASKRIGFPMIVRAAYALGGLGSGFANNETELTDLVENALRASPQVLLEKSLRGWKELEYEVMRDSQGSAISICNMENLDPLGIHTGESIVVAPSQTLSDREFQILRSAALRIADSLGIIGECNVQFALSPNSQEFFVIEVNARLSRSSALASKATGYPIAYIAAKVVLGQALVDLKNPVTGVTTAFYEPSLDYVIIKIPRWDMLKFEGASRRLGSSMKSVGEVMAIGRGFNEAIQKAVRMVSERPEGLSHEARRLDPQALRNALAHATDERIFHLMQAFRDGMSLEEIHDLTSIDRWFLDRLQEISEMEREIVQDSAAITADPAQTKSALSQINKQKWFKWKAGGFGDEQIASLALSRAPDRSAGAVLELARCVRMFRQSHGIVPFAKNIDTTAAEFPSDSSYFFLTYQAACNDLHIGRESKAMAVILGGGPYRIGSSVEFDWCAVTTAAEVRDRGWESIIINCNPETVSTDYCSSSRLYFEELTLERILDVLELEGWKPEAPGKDKERASIGVIACVGGQLPNKLIGPMAQAGIPILGHSPDTVDLAEDRARFSALLDQHQVAQPRWIAAKSKAELHAFVAELGFPLLVRPSYVLSGSAMKVAYDQRSLDIYLELAQEASREHPVVLSQFLMGAREVDVDGVAVDGRMIASVLSEHIENAGVHSGDASLVTPPFRLEQPEQKSILEISEKICHALSLNGPFNIQFLVHWGDIRVIECNARASRSLPFVSKVTARNLARLSAQVLIRGQDALCDTAFDAAKYPQGYGVKAPMFSFNRLSGIDPVLGVEMVSTGEVASISPDLHHAVLAAFEASGIHIPRRGVLVSAGPDYAKVKFLNSLGVLERMGLRLFATPGTARFLAEHGKKAESVDGRADACKAIFQLIREGQVDFVINIPKNLADDELLQSASIRSAAVQVGCSLITDIEKATMFLASLDDREAGRGSAPEVTPLLAFR